MLLNCGVRLLRVPWTARRWNWSILKETGPEYSLEGLMLKLKFPHFGHLIRRADSLEKILMLGKTEGRGRAWQRMRRLDGITDFESEQAPGVGDGQGSLACAVHGVTKSQTWLRTELSDKIKVPERPCSLLQREHFLPTSFLASSSFWWF